MSPHRTAAQFDTTAEDADHTTTLFTMLDINLFRVDKGGNPDIVRESQRRRYAPVEAVDKVIELDAAWRNARYELDNLNRDFNKTNKEVAKKKIAKEDASELIAECQEIQAKIKVAENVEKEAEATCMAELNKIGNLVHIACPSTTTRTTTKSRSCSERLARQRRARRCTTM